MVQIPPPPKLRITVAKPKPVGGLVPPPVAAAAQAVKHRASSALDKLRGARAVGTNPLFQEYLEALCDEGPTGDELRSQLIAHGREELNRRQALIQPVSEFLKPFWTPQARMKLAQDVLRPAQMRQRSSQEILDKLSNLFDQVTTSQLMTWLESRLGPLTIGIGGGAEAGVGAGMEGGMGIAFRRHHGVAVTHSFSLALGAYAKAAASVQASVAPGNPQTGEGVTVDVSFSYASGQSLEVVLALAPTLHKPTGLLRIDKGKDTLWHGILVDYSFAGLALSVGVGTGVSGAAGVTHTTSFLLPGIVR
jgi:hypothetical protein